MCNRKVGENVVKQIEFSSATCVFICKATRVASGCSKQRHIITILLLSLKICLKQRQNNQHSLPNEEKDKEKYNIQTFLGIHQRTQT